MPTLQPNDCAQCGSALVPGLVCCAAGAQRASMVARRPVIAQRVQRKATLPRDTYAIGTGADNTRAQFYPGHAQVWRAKGPVTSVGHGRDNYAFARNSALLHRKWVPA